MLVMFVLVSIGLMSPVNSKKKKEGCDTLSNLGVKRDYIETEGALGSGRQQGMSRVDLKKWLCGMFLLPNFPRVPCQS